MGDVGDRLAHRVANAADAHLRDPLDVNAYAHLVDAVTAWRAHTAPTFEGLDVAGRPSLAQIEEAARVAASGQGDLLDVDVSGDDPARRPVTVGGVMAGTLEQIRRAAEAQASTGEQPD